MTAAAGTTGPHSDDERRPRESGATPKTTSRRRRLIIRLGHGGSVVVAAYFLIAYLIRSWGTIQDFDWSARIRAGWSPPASRSSSTTSPRPSSGGCSCAAAARAVPFRPAASVWGKSILARYVPGNVFMFVGRAWMSHSQGLSVERVSAAMVYEEAIGVCSAFFCDCRPLPLPGVPAGVDRAEPPRHSRAGGPGHRGSSGRSPGVCSACSTGRRWTSRWGSAPSS